MPLKRHSSLIPLSHDHRSGLFAANLIRTGAPRYQGVPTDLPGKRAYLLQFAEQELTPHLALEEQVLFPLVEGLSDEIKTLVQALRVEHQDLRHMLTHLPPADASDLQVALDQLSGLLNAHIRKEERQLFEAIQAIMSEEELLDLGETLRSAGEDLKNPPQ